MSYPLHYSTTSKLGIRSYGELSQGVRAVRRMPYLTDEVNP